MNKKVLTVSIFLSIFIAGILIGKFLLGVKVLKAPNPQNVEEVRLSGYKFINPLLECEIGKDAYIINGLDLLHDRIESYIKNKKERGSITNAAVYFRDLQNGPWFGVDEHADFSPASLLKLPVLIAYLNKAEDDPSILKKEIVFNTDAVILKQDFSKFTLTPNKKYTVDELLFYMITKSDNEALILLENNIDNTLIDKVTLDLGVETANANTPENFMSVKGYAGLFRILFNASYLSQKYSEKALSILSKTEFDKGIKAGIPPNIAVAHKYGERELVEGVQLHECGIIYYPNHPYLLCIMTRGNDYNKLVDVIKNVSKTVYDDLDKKYRTH